jgi:hypothetical protein
MLNIKLDTKSDLSVKWPLHDPQILALGAAYVAYESSLTAQLQLKDITLAMMQTALTSAQTAATSAGGGEAARAIAAETLRQKYATAQPLLENAINQLKAKYYANLAQLENWGLETVAGGNPVTVRKPRTQTAWIAFLKAYVTKEAALPVADQLTVPALATLQTLNTDIQAALVARDAGRTTREVGVLGRSAATQRLLDLLQVACAILVAVKYNGVVTNNLQSWGFLVEAKTPTKPPEGDPPTP